MNRYEEIALKENPNSNDYGRIHMDTQLKKFRAERNFYLHFFALILVGYVSRGAFGSSSPSCLISPLVLTLALLGAFRTFSIARMPWRTNGQHWMALIVSGRRTSRSGFSTGADFDWAKIKREDQCTKFS